MCGWLGWEEQIVGLGRPLALDLQSHDRVMIIDCVNGSQSEITYQIAKGHGP